MLRVEDLGLSVGPADKQRLVFSHVSFAVSAGEFVALMGRSGAGKSSILRMAAGLVSPTRGHIRTAGIDVSSLSPSGGAKLRRDTVSLVFQDYNLIETLTAIENVSLPLEINKTARRKAHRIAAEAMAVVGITELHRQLPAQLSGGEQQRVAVARAMVSPGSVILADEPTGAVDRVAGFQVVALLREASRRGKSVLMVTHDPEVARQADRTLVLEPEGVRELSPETVG